MDKIVAITAKFDLNEMEKIVEDGLGKKDEAELFATLAEISKYKKLVADVADAVDKVERDVKGIINSKAKAIYGNEWQAIVGKGFKISRSFTGAKYDHTGEAPEEFIIVKTSVDSKAVDKHVVETNELPTGIAVNSKRGEQIRITVKDEPDAN